MQKCGRQLLGPLYPHDPSFSYKTSKQTNKQSKNKNRTKTKNENKNKNKRPAKWFSQGGPPIICKNPI